MNRLLIYSVALLIIVAVLMFAKIAHLKNKAEKGEEYRGLYEASAIEAKTWKDKHDQWHSKAQELAVSNSTLQQMSKQDPDLIRLLLEVKGIKKNLSNLQGFNIIGTQSTTSFETILKDTTIYRGDTVLKAHEFDYQTKWDSYKGFILGNTVFLQREGRDSLDIAAYFTRRWFLGKKTYSSEVVSANPDTKITYNRALVVKRKRKK